MHRDPPPGITEDNVSNGPQSVNGLKQSVANLSSEGKQSVVTTVLQDLPPEATQNVAAEAVRSLPTEAKQDVAAEAVRSLPPEAKKNVATEMVQTLSPEDQAALAGRLQGPDQRVTNRTWEIIVCTFAGALILSIIALIGAAFWSSDNIQILLTVFTTVTGILAGFISGRASSSRPTR